jgi:deoxyribodipyrimidine photolyase
MEIKSILWFRHGLRLHDNPSLLAAIENGRKNVRFYPIFIFDGESGGELRTFVSSIFDSFDIEFRSYY